jgi:hypothetical protein
MSMGIILCIIAGVYPFSKAGWRCIPTTYLDPFPQSPFILDLVLVTRHNYFQKDLMKTSVLFSKNSTNHVVSNGVH